MDFKPIAPLFFDSLDRPIIPKEIPEKCAGAYLSRYLRTDFESQLTCSPFWFTKADLNESKKLTASWTEYVFSSLSLAILEEESMLERNHTGTHF